MAGSFPEGWNVWYASPFLGREGVPVRAAALASKDLKSRFAQASSLVREHLARIGIATIPSELCAMVSELSRLPLTLEWRVTMDGQGQMRDRCDVSFYLSRTYMSGSDVRRSFGEGSAGARALELLQGWGVADDRWRDVIAGSYAGQWSFALDDGSLCGLVGVCSPSCFMAPWERGLPLPAKAYPKMDPYLRGLA